MLATPRRSLTQIALILLIASPHGAAAATPNMPAFKDFSKLKGNASEGRALFLGGTLECGSCHAIGAKEESDAPNLFGVGSRLSRDQIISSIFEPSKDLAPGYKRITVLLDDGRQLCGTESEAAGDSKTLVLITDDRTVVKIDRTTIESLAVQGSDMPDGLADDLQPQAVADLVAFLESLKK